MVNVPKMALTLILALYAIGKPYDSVDTETNNVSPTGLVLVRKMITNIEEVFFENHKSDLNHYSKESPLLPTYSRKNTEHEDYINEFKVFVKQKHPSIAHLGSFRESRSKNSQA